MQMSRAMSALRQEKSLDLGRKYHFPILAPQVICKLPSNCEKCCGRSGNLCTILRVATQSQASSCLLTAATFTIFKPWESIKKLHGTLRAHHAI